MALEVAVELPAAAAVRLEEVAEADSPRVVDVVVSPPAVAHEADLAVDLHLVEGVVDLTKG